MKKIYLLMIRSFLGPFIAIFFIANITFVLQLFWLYLDDMIGKGLQLVVIGKLFYYMFLTMVPQSLPIAVMMAAIMSFGNLGENFELVAIKSAGVSFMRFMSPLFYLAIIISCISFSFNSYIIPNAYLKRTVLMYSIISSSPAFEIQEGVFFTKIPGSVIRIGKKEKDGPGLENILVIQKKQDAPDEIMVAQTGKILVSPDKRFFNFYLYNGYHYIEHGKPYNTNNDFIKVHFKNYIKTFDITSFSPIDINVGSFKKMARTMNINKIREQADTNTIRHVALSKSRKEKINEIFPLSIITSLKSSYEETENLNTFATLEKKVRKDKNNIITETKNNVYDFMSIVNHQRNYESFIKKEAQLYYLEYHNRFSWSILCIVFFLIGAPLGAITKKGGVGLPLLISIINFTAFFFFYSSLVKSVRQNALDYHIAAWLPICSFLVIGIIFCYKALHDSNVFDKEIYYRLYYKILYPLIHRKKSK